MCHCLMMHCGVLHGSCSFTMPKALPVQGRMMLLSWVQSALFNTVAHLIQHFKWPGINNNNKETGWMFRFLMFALFGFPSLVWPQNTAEHIGYWCWSLHQLLWLILVQYSSKPFEFYFTQHKTYLSFDQNAPQDDWRFWKKSRREGNFWFWFEPP